MDLNNDGSPDLLSGSYSRREQPMAGLFQVLWGQPDGTFKKAAVLNGADEQPLVIANAGGDSITEAICTRPTAVDWNGDGKLDLVVGNFTGTFYVFLGASGGQFHPQSEAIPSGAGRLKIEGAHSDPFVVDWDGDGDLDLLSGSEQGGVQWAENVARKGKLPELKPFKSLIKAGPKFEHGQLLSEKELTGPAGATRVWAEDVNSDGKLDLLVGDCVMLISTAEGVSKNAFGKKFAKWRQEVDAALKKMNEPGDDKNQEAARERYREIYQQRTEFMVEARTGFVWLYVQK